MVWEGVIEGEIPRVLYHFDIKVWCTNMGVDERPREKVANHSEIHEEELFQTIKKRKN